ncbi:hypothetical protein BCR44DRAFT_1458787 [Catenaria anguillulae PL171]|uniref:Uncharacterized protein n=1 Tax=Catenaria anguillulae PL171 TaxID=765915 RepID=A0A1Y2HWD7_9FUNG|nr:hypothetical protein BCR44DRAFT_1458787 [Catenaria anguillulae PL171]
MCKMRVDGMQKSVTSGFSGSLGKIAVVIAGGGGDDDDKDSVESGLGTMGRALLLLLGLAVGAVKAKDKEEERTARAFGAFRKKKCVEESAEQAEGHSKDEGVEGSKLSVQSKTFMQGNLSESKEERGPVYVV